MPETITPPPTIELAETNNRDTTREQDRGLGWGDRGAVNLTMALRGLTANKLRAFLTMLGVIIGVGAVIIAIAIGQGSRAAVAASLQQLGTNVLTVRPGQQRSGGISFGYGSNVTLKLSDADAILKSCPSVLHVSPQVNKNAQVKYGDKNTNTTINGTSEFIPSSATTRFAKAVISMPPTSNRSAGSPCLAPIRPTPCLAASLRSARPYGSPDRVSRWLVCCNLKAVRASATPTTACMCR